MPEIDEDSLAAAQAAVRYQQIMRYEQMYEIVDSRISEDKSGGRPLDPRFLELGIRILKEEAVIYRLAKAVVVQEEEEDPSITGVDRAAVVMAKLDELEAKRTAQAQAAQAAANAREQDRTAAS
jgi:predicted metalloprotease